MVSVRHVCMFYSELGGVERSVVDLVNGLKDSHCVDVLCNKHGRGVQIESINEVVVTKAGSPFSIAGRPVSRSFIHHLGGTRTDIVHYHLPCPLATIGHLLRPPAAKIAVATWHHDLQRYPLLNSVQMAVLWRLFKVLDAIIVTSPIMIDVVPILSQHREKCSVIPLGIDESRFSVDLQSQDEIDQIRKQYGKQIVLFVGRLVYYKGCEILLRAMRSIDAQLVIVGEGPLENELKALANDLGIAQRVHFTGRLSDSVLTSMYKASDVFVLPSTQRTECFGLVQIEAMLSGVPVINTSLPTGVPWVSQHEVTGLTVKPGDVDELAGAIARLLANEKQRTEYGSSARIRALENFTLSHQVRATSELYANLLARFEPKSRASKAI